ncbi:hypothetical protein [Nocardia sp. NPDC051833]|uniref:hypothetical protein n=1 Tax=Nocardia sp. NPDC051833 TaxID=3155674 RepID=UPI0034247FB7
MTAEEIRAEAIERVARADYLRRYRADGFMWETTTEAIRGRHRAAAALAVDALGDMLPTGVERLAAYAVTDRTDDRLMQRYTTNWQDVTA